MSGYRTSELESALSRKGFVRHDTHHKMFTYFFRGKKTSVRTRISHGVGEYGDALLAKMAKQLRLSKERLKEFIECPLTAARYADHLRDDGHIRE